QWMSNLYNLIGTIYSELKFYDKSVDYYKKAIATAQEINDTEGVYAIKINTARGLYSRNKPAQALEILNSGTKYNPVNNCDVEYASIYILVYCQLKQYSKAKPYYDQLVRCGNSGKKDHIRQEKRYYAMVVYLLKTGQADKTYAYLAELRKLSAVHNDLLNLAQLEKVHFEADSATANYLGAISHLKSFKQLNDSLFNISSTKQFADLQLEYETEKKDKNIKLLKQHGQLQETRLNNEIIMRYVFIASLIVLFLILGLLYGRYCIKQKNNRILEAKQEEINRQNVVLRRLVDEKEWLLKEIHHRVKNNLQIVISLLNTQSAYLENEDALMAIQNSQHRMHAMSLIHQRLYQSDNLASIDMSWYIYELVNYLKESFDLDRKISYKLDTERVELDVAQAVPLGLILNEAISNAIKYAFNNRPKGQVTVSLKSTGGEGYQLTIADDGIGVPDGFEHQERESLGMNLMMGLTNQLDGTFTLQNNNGLAVAITFIRKQQLPGDAHNSEN
ncbi:MAG: histidine kinase, partial [Sphingobacteriales bacterium]